MAKFKTEKNSNYYSSSKTAIKQSGMKNQLEWIKRQLEYADFSEKYSLRYDLKRGEIYEIDWGININAEFSNRHFGVVLVDSDAFNPLVTVCPLKSNHAGANPKSDIDLGFIPELGTMNTTLAVVNQVRTIDKLRIYLRRAIGRYGDRFLCDSYDEEKSSVMRLTNDKLKQVLDGYKRYLESAIAQIVVRDD